ncbi:hypothetical protein B0T17DRAFT_482976 [Bombardia bombarda]|uniref:Kinase n=1 Tax=Bombardia bombarda TaxID=252184 RepID=A0AA39XN33_9PEZI|nr:hypothetical protein B0T17DRAFT_482976 [Bombardia bombarda]
MIPSRPLPNSADLKPYNFAVAGHEGTLCDPDGELFIKPCTQQEINFYETAYEDHKSFAELMPVYIGTLSLNDATDMESLNEQLPAAASHISQGMKEEALRLAKENAAEAVAEAAKKAAAIRDHVTWHPNKTRKIATNKSVVLENTAYGYVCPNILDAKLGRRLWADDAPLEKRRRFDEISKATTNGSHGFRIAGMRVYKGSEDPAELDADGYKVYDKDYGRLQVNQDNVVDEMRKFIFNRLAGVDDDIGRAVAEAFLHDLRRVEEVLAGEESRMYSASLLFTFEGDGDALRAAIEQTPSSAASSVSEQGKKEKAGVVAVADVKMLGYGAEGDFFAQADMGQEDDEEDDDDEDMTPMPHIWSLKLIDFAHAEWVPGQGPDENVLLGVRSLIKIFEELSQ